MHLKCVRPSRGFTLIELTVVIFIVGLALGIVAIAISRIHEKTVFRETTVKIFNMLKQARQLALLDRTTVSFKFDPDKKTFWIEKGDTIYGRTQNLPVNIRIDGDRVNFFSKGNCSGGTIKIFNDKGREFSIEFDTTLGMPKVKGL